MLADPNAAPARPVARARSTAPAAAFPRIPRPHQHCRPSFAPLTTATPQRRRPPLSCHNTTSMKTAQQVLLDPAEGRWPFATVAASGDGDGDGAAEAQAGPGPRRVIVSDVAGPEVSFVSLVDGKFTVRGRLVLPAPAARVYDLLSDFEGCHRVFSNIAASEVLRPEEGEEEEGELQVVQACRWQFLAFSGTFRVHLSVRQDPVSGTLLFRLVQSNFMRDFEGKWTVRPAEHASGLESAAVASDGGSDGGSDGRGGGWCLVEHQLSVVPAVAVPAPVAYYTRSIFVRQVEGILLDLQRAVLA